MSRSDLVIDASRGIEIHIDGFVAVPVIKIQVVALGNNQLGDGGCELKTDIQSQTMNATAEVKRAPNAMSRQRSPAFPYRHGDVNYALLEQ